jgi:hypothetical protein
VEYYFSQQFQDCSLEDMTAHWDLRRLIADPDNSPTFHQFEQLAELQERTSSRKCTFALVRYFRANLTGSKLANGSMIVTRYP